MIGASFVHGAVHGAALVAALAGALTTSGDAGAALAEGGAVAGRATAGEHEQGGQGEAEAEPGVGIHSRHGELLQVKR